MIVIGTPFAPSKMVKKEVKDGYRLTLSYGGGMGGSTLDLFSTDDVPTLIKNSQFITINDNIVKGDVVNINFIVRATPVKIVHIEVENKGNHNFDNKVSKYYYCNKDTELAFADTYTDLDKYKSTLHSIIAHNPSFLG